MRSYFIGIKVILLSITLYVLIKMGFEVVQGTDIFVNIIMMSLHLGSVVILILSPWRLDDPVIIERHGHPFHPSISDEDWMIQRLLVARLYQLAQASAVPYPEEFLDPGDEESYEQWSARVDAALERVALSDQEREKP